MTRKPSSVALLSQLHAIEMDLVEAYALENVASLASSMIIWQTLIRYCNIVITDSDGHLRPSTVDAICRTASRIEILAAQFATLSSIVSDAQLDLVQTMSGRPSQQSLVSFAPYRRFFLDHLDHPYPNAADQRILLTLVPSHKPQQLLNWFVNARRRSEWQAIYKLHGRGDRSTMELLVRRYHANIAVGQVVGRGSSAAQEANESLARVHRYLAEGGRDHVAPWFIQVLAPNSAADDAASIEAKRNRSTLMLHKRKRSSRYDEDSEASYDESDDNRK